MTEERRVRYPDLPVFPTSAKERARECIAEIRTYLAGSLRIDDIVRSLRTSMARDQYLAHYSQEDIDDLETVPDALDASTLDSLVGSNRVFDEHMISLLDRLTVELLRGEPKAP